MEYPYCTCSCVGMYMLTPSNGEGRAEFNLDDGRRDRTSSHPWELSVNQPLLSL